MKVAITAAQQVRRVANAVARHPLMFPMPLWFHRVLGWFRKRTMNMPVVSSAQAQMLEELAELAPGYHPMPPDLGPRIRFTPEQIRKGLPQPGPFTWRDLRCCTPRHPSGKARHSKRVFFEMP